MVSLKKNLLGEADPMESDIAKTTKVVRNLNLVTRSRLLLNSLRFLPLCALVGLVAGGVFGLLFAIPGSFALAVMAELLSGVIGATSSNLLYGTGRSARRPREQFVGTLNQVRYHKICKEFQKALWTVEEVLAGDPDFSEALLLKAQILWEGFEDRSGAKICLIKILKVEPNKKSPFHRWALTLYKEIVDSQRKREVRSQTIGCSN
jgi:hypothetical protein